MQVEFLRNRLPFTRFRQLLLSMLTKAKPQHYPAFLGLLILAKQENSIVDEKLCARARYMVDIQNVAALVE